MANYEFWYCDESGNRLEYISLVGGVEFVHVQGDVGAAIFDFPILNLIHEEIRPERRIHIYRQPIGGALTLEFVCFLNIWTFYNQFDGREALTLQGDDQNNLLTRRVVAYHTESAEAKKSEAADDMMYNIVDENMGSSAGDYAGSNTNRDMTGNNFSIKTSPGNGPTVNQSIAWRPVLETLQDIQAITKSQSNEVFFGCRPISDTKIEFEVKTGQWGNDRTQSTGTDPIIFSMENGNLVQPSLTHDYSNVENYVYGKGEGRQSDTEISEKSNASRIGLSAWGRKEKLSNATLSYDVADETADDDLARGRPKITLQGDLLSTPQAPYGGLIGWKLGDRVTINYANRQFDSVIRSVRIKLDADGRETITSRIEDLAA